MLEAAIDAARTGKHVVVVAANKRHIEHLLQMTSEIMRDQSEPTAYFRNPDSLVVGAGRMLFIPWSHPQWVWPARRMQGFAHDTPIFIDHFTIEWAFPAVIAEWSRYLVPAPPVR